MSHGIIDHLCQLLAREYLNDVHTSMHSDNRVLIALHQVLINQNLILDKLVRLLPGPVTRFTFRPVEDSMADFTLGIGQYQDFSITPEDAAGNPVPDANALTFSSSDETIATVAAAPADVVVDAPAVAMRVTAAQKAGVAQITVSDGTISSVQNLTITPGAVAQFVAQPIGSPQPVAAS